MNNAIKCLNRLSADSVFWTRCNRNGFRSSGRGCLNRLSADSVFWTLGRSRPLCVTLRPVSIAFRLIRSFGHPAGGVRRGVGVGQSLNRLSADSVFWTPAARHEKQAHRRTVSIAFRLIRSFGLERPATSADVSAVSQSPFG